MFNRLLLTLTFLTMVNNFVHAQGTYHVVNDNQYNGSIAHVDALTSSVEEKSEIVVSDRSKKKALLLSIFLGPVGGTHFYTGHKAKGVMKFTALASMFCGFTAADYLDNKGSVSKQRLSNGLLFIGFVVACGNLIWYIKDIVDISKGKFKDHKGFLVTKK